MVLFWLKSGTASTAACTDVKSQHPFGSTQRYEVVLVSLGKSGEKPSHGVTIFPFLLCLLHWWWCPPLLYAMTVAVIGDDKKKWRLKWVRYLRNDGFEFVICVDAKTAKMVNRKLRDVLRRFIFCMKEMNRDNMFLEGINRYATEVKDAYMLRAVHWAKWPDQTNWIHLTWSLTGKPEEHGWSDLGFLLIKTEDSVRIMG